ncbi:hypothetical protein Avbf_09173 [Armadillidium vulgare]|nr:hypothetical protein Avbf_09173 [Armadillidium vulgare]
MEININKKILILSYTRTMREGGVRYYEKSKTSHHHSLEIIIIGLKDYEKNIVYSMLLNLCYKTAIFLLKKRKPQNKMKRNSATNLDV